MRGRVRTDLLLPILSVAACAVILMVGLLGDLDGPPEQDAKTTPHNPPTLSKAEKPKHQVDMDALEQALAHSGGDPRQLLKLFEKSSSTLLETRWLELGPDDVVADIGAGTGALPLRLLAKDAPFHSYLAVDIDAPSLDLLAAMLDSLTLPRTETVIPVLATPTDCGLAPTSVDVFLVVDVTPLGCEPDDNTLPFLQSLRRAARPEARLHHFLARFPEGSEFPRRDCAAEDIQALYQRAGFSVTRFTRRPMEQQAGLTIEHTVLGLAED